MQNNELKKLSTSVYMERTDYEDVLHTIAIKPKTLLIEITALIIGIIGLICINNINLSTALIVIDVIIFEGEYLYRKKWVSDQMKKIFPEKDHPITLRTIYEFKPQHIPVTVENYENTKDFIVKYDQLHRRRYTKSFVIFTTRDKKHHLIFQKGGEQDRFFKKKWDGNK